MRYDFGKIERKWQKAWAKRNFGAWHGKDFAKKPKLYVLDMFPYPSGEGLHVGHAEGYTATDIYSRWLRMRGYNVLHPMGWDAFGLPAENYAIKTKTHPAVVVEKNVKRFRQQLQSIGFSYDWRREVNTTDPRYYKWTQWIFLQLFKKGLAYEADVSINWCPSCKTGLANEEVVDGECERCGARAERKMLRQWILKITAYAERLLEDLERLGWPENVKEMQRNWIGRSEGYELDFKVAGNNLHIRVFTTRPDTLFGATYMVLAPEHPSVEHITTASEQAKVREYVKRAGHKLDLERAAEKEKTGVFTGAYALNPATRERIPIWVSDYVLMSYGTGAIMAVPAHDQRDLEFARRHHLQIRKVIVPQPLFVVPRNADDIAMGLKSDIRVESDCYEGEGLMINSGPFDRLDSQSAKEKIAAYVGGKKTVKYKLRDWIFSRQRYWGEPIPLVFCSACKERVENEKRKTKNDPFDKTQGRPEQKSKDEKRTEEEKSAGELLNPGWVPVPEKDLPVPLPQVKSYEPTGTGESPLAAIAEWVSAKCPRCGGPARRETNTMPQWAGSCWYYLAYVLNEKLKTKNAKLFWDKRVLEYWLPVDVYVGGVEHAVLHLLYARFWHKVLYDIGAVSTKEPFQKLVNQGLILGPDGEKMSKSRGNVINPDDMVREYGADSLRLYEMFMGPLEQVKPWDPQGIVGMHRFLNRVWELAIQKANEKRKTPPAGRAGKNEKAKMSQKAQQSAGTNIKRVVHKTIKKVTEDIAAMRFNTAISAMMELQNAISFQAHQLSRSDFAFAIRNLLLLLSPFAPHIAEELRQTINDKRRTIKSIRQEAWPKYDPRLIKEDTVTYAIQVNGKLRDTMKVGVDVAEEEVLKRAKASEKVSKWIGGKKITRTVFVKGKLVNFVV